MKPTIVKQTVKPKEKKKVKVVMVGHNPISIQTKKCLEKLFKVPHIEWKFDADTNVSTTVSKSKLIADAEKYSHILFMTPNIVFSVEDFLKLMQHQKPIICGAYKDSKGDWYVAGMKDKDVHIKTDVKKGIHGVDWVGMDFTLVETSIFSKMKKPYFEMPAGEDGEVQMDDLNFCMKHPGKVFLNCDTNVIIAPQEKGVYLPNVMWSEVLKAVINHPLPYSKAVPLIDLMKHYLS